MGNFVKSFFVNLFVDKNISNANSKDLKISSQKDSNNTIVLIDSGIGGLHILKECYKLLPNFNYVYVSDDANAPYGNKSKQELIEIADNLLEKAIKEFEPMLVVLACNTLTVNCIKHLRRKFKISIVGIEPALKKARINGGDIIIFATQSTLKYYNRLNKKCTWQLRLEYRKNKLRYYNKDKVHKVYISGLPAKIDEEVEKAIIKKSSRKLNKKIEQKLNEEIENNIKSNEETTEQTDEAVEGIDNIANENKENEYDNNLNSLMSILLQEFDNPIYKNTENLVLGCTHFIAIKKQLENIFGEKVQIYDGAIPVAKRVQFLIENDLKHNSNLKPIKKVGNFKNIKFSSTSGNPNKAKVAKTYFKNIYKH
ncbi:MAG: hypothetical protein PHX09_01675 [Clostridia bacterium]|nr:hypothetical protein [Clostridia bacterium]MDD4685777.1 hypothetical protein [Clostridia bacterium]